MVSVLTHTLAKMLQNWPLGRHMPLAAARLSRWTATKRVGRIDVYSGDTMHDRYLMYGHEWSGDKQRG